MELIVSEKSPCLLANKRQTWIFEPLIIRSRSSRRGSLYRRSANPISAGALVRLGRSREAEDRAPLARRSGCPPEDHQGREPSLCLHQISDGERGLGRAGCAENREAREAGRDGRGTRGQECVRRIRRNPRRSAFSRTRSRPLLSHPQFRIPRPRGNRAESASDHAVGC